MLDLSSRLHKRNIEKKKYFKKCINSILSILGIQQNFSKCQNFSEIGNLLSYSIYFSNFYSFTKFYQQHFNILKILSFFQPCMSKKTKIPFPIELVLVVLGTLASYFLDFPVNYGITNVGEIPTGYIHITQRFWILFYPECSYFLVYQAPQCQSLISFPTS